LSIRRLDALAVQRVQRLHIGQVDPERLTGDATLGQLSVDATG
jgi:hypothetical protein